MEKFRIALYGMAQVTAIVYGVLAAGAAVKINSRFADEGQIMPEGYYRALFYRDHGFLLLLLVLAWAVVISWLAFVPSRWSIEERTINITGIGLALLFVVAGTYFAVNGFAVQIASAQS